MIFQIYSYALNITWKKQCLANFWPPTAPGPRALHNAHPAHPIATPLEGEGRGRGETRKGERQGGERVRPLTLGTLYPSHPSRFRGPWLRGVKINEMSRVWQLCALRSIHARQLISAACHVTHLWPITWEHRSSCWDDKWKENKNADAFAIPVCTVTRHICWAPQ